MGRPREYITTARQWQAAVVLRTMRAVVWEHAAAMCVCKMRARQWQVGMDNVREQGRQLQREGKVCVMYIRKNTRE